MGIAISKPQMILFFDTHTDIQAWVPFQLPMILFVVCIKVHICMQVYIYTAHEASMRQYGCLTNTTRKGPVRVIVDMTRVCCKSFQLRGLSAMTQLFSLFLQNTGGVDDS